MMNHPVIASLSEIANSPGQVLDQLCINALRILAKARVEIVGCLAFTVWKSFAVVRVNQKP